MNIFDLFSELLSNSPHACDDELYAWARSEIERLADLEKESAEARATIREWVSKQGHDRCWYYPDLFRRLASLHGVEGADPRLPPLDEFKKGCEQYQEEEYTKQ